MVDTVALTAAVAALWRACPALDWVSLVLTSRTAGTPTMSVTQ